tara:strand:+ start:11815 stop:12138 length:324 start_codon:yes stop_codon:yes gene_type:complete
MQDWAGASRGSCGPLNLLSKLGFDNRQAPEQTFAASQNKRKNGLDPDFRRALHERLLLDKNLWSQHVGQIRSIPPVSRAPCKINDFAVTQTPGKTFAVLAGFCHNAA